jgi:hypothetical protein
MDNVEKNSLAGEKGKVFGKPLSQYVRFQMVFLALIAVAGIVRLGLSLAGLPDATAKWSSMTVVSLVGILYYGVAVHTKGFGSYKQLLPLLVIQNVLANSIAIVGIALTIAGVPNIFGAPEYSGPLFAAHQWGHMLGHVIAGMGIISFMGWGVASLVMLITKKVAPRPALA